MERSSGSPTEVTRIRTRRPDGVPVYGYRRAPGIPDIGVARFGGPEHAEEDGRREHAHAHDFLVVVFVESGEGRLLVNGRARPVAAGDTLVVGPGVVVLPERAALATVRGWGVFFPADVVEAHSTSTSSWRSHPLLFPFAAGSGDGACLRVPAGDRPGWSARLAALEREVRERRDGSTEAASAHLLLLLVDLARLAADDDGRLRARDEPVVAAVFDVIEQRYREPLSLRDVADRLGLTPGHLTTVVGRRTGRTVQQWIIERRMREARALLAQDGCSVQDIASRVGYRDAGYFIRRFRRAHGMTPEQWRRAARSPNP